MLDIEIALIVVRLLSCIVLIWAGHSEAINVISGLAR